MNSRQCWGIYRSARYAYVARPAYRCTSIVNRVVQVSVSAAPFEKLPSAALAAVVDEFNIDSSAWDTASMLAAGEEVMVRPSPLSVQRRPTSITPCSARLFEHPTSWGRLFTCTRRRGCDARSGCQRVRVQGDGDMKSNSLIGTWVATQIRSRGH